MNITEWLTSIGLEECASAFQANHIGMDALGSLNRDDLRELGVTSVGHRIKLLEEIHKLSATGASESTQQSANALASQTQRRWGMWFIDNPYSQELGSQNTSVHYVFEIEDCSEPMIASILALAELGLKTGELTLEWHSSMIPLLEACEGIARMTQASDLPFILRDQLREAARNASRLAQNCGWYLLLGNELFLSAGEFDVDRIRHYFGSVPIGVAALDLAADTRITITGCGNDPEDGKAAFIEYARWADLVSRCDLEPPTLDMSDFVASRSTSNPARLDFGGPENVKKVLREFETGE